jgi:hypothetical protein
MPNVRNLSRSFAAGEITPELYGRVDLDQFQTGLATCRNFVTLPHGPAANRAGTLYVLETPYNAKRSRMIPFSYSATQTMALEFGDRYIRFHTLGETLVENGVGITAITNTNPAVVAAPAHGYNNGDTVYLNGITNMPGLNARWVKISNPTSDTFSLLDLAGFTISAVGMPPYGGAGTVARAYSLVSPYVEADLFDLHYVQSADVLTITHPNYPPMELRRLGAINWTLTQIDFVSSMTAPTDLNGVATPPSSGTPHNQDYVYVVTALAATTQEESLPSATLTINNDMTLVPAKNTVTWAAVDNADRYRVYRKYQGIFAYLGQTQDVSFDDQNITPDPSVTPPALTNPFLGATNYPQAVGYHQQRRCFASTITLPQSMWMTRSGTESNLSGSTPARDSDAITFRIAAREANTIRHIVPLAELVLLTSSAEWVVTANGSASAALTTSTLSVQPQGYNGASNVVPITVSNSLLYAFAMGGHIGEMTYNYYAGGYVTQDVSVLAPHLFDFKTIVDMAYAKAPYPFCWFVSSDGTLLGLTYAPMQKVSAWHHHDTDGAFESVCTVTEGNESAVYFIVNRNVNGRQVRYVERLHSRQIDKLTDSFFVDCGVLYNGAPVNVLSGLYHLEGKTVSVLADGAVQPPQVVKDGTITIPVAASVIAAGLPITSDIQTLPFSFMTEAYGQGRAKNVNKVWLRVHNSSGISVGPTVDELVQYKQRTTEPYGTPPALVTGEIEMSLTGAWDQDGSVCVRQTDPLPLTIASMTIEVAIGG